MQIKLNHTLIGEQVGDSFPPVLLPTLNEAIEHMKKHGGRLKAKKQGVVWEEDNVPTAEELC